MVDTWMGWPIWAIVLALMAGLGTWCLVLHLVTFHLVPRERMLRYNGLVAPFFTGLAVMFALLTGFVANDAWERNRQASRAVLAERDGLLNVYYLSVASAPDMSAIRAAERDYIGLVVNEDWPRMRDQGRSSTAGAALGALLSLVSDPKVEKEAGVAVHEALVQSVLRVRTARYDRLAISGDHADSLKWVSVILIALLTMIALALEHLDRARVQLVALILYALGVSAALGPVAIRERPFSGELRLSAAPLSDVLDIMKRDAARPVAPAGQLPRQ